MDNSDILKSIRGGLIVSCQALDNEPLYGSQYMSKMAIAAKAGGAAGIRANYSEDIKAIKEAVDLPVIGLIKKTYPNSQVYITPTVKEVGEVVAAGAEIVAIDATHRTRPDNKTISEFILEIKSKFDVLILADISTYEESQTAVKAGADLISTTLSGYTDYSPKLEGPDFFLLKRLAEEIEIPVIGEGRIWTPEEAKEAMNLGAYAVVVGSAITRPQLITERFAKAIKDPRC